METFGATSLEDVQFESDGSLKSSGKQNVKFYNKKIIASRAKVDESGKPVINPKTGMPFMEAYEDTVEMVRIESKGDTNIIDDRVDEVRKRQFYRQYKAFKEGKIPDGNPIEDFEYFQPSTIMELHMLGIHVIQQVASMTDLDCERLRDQSGYDLRDFARSWVRIHTPQGQSEKATRLEQENLALKRQLEAMQGKITESARQYVAPQQEEVPEEVMETVEIKAEDLGKPKIKRTVK